MGNSTSLRIALNGVLSADCWATGAILPREHIIHIRTQTRPAIEFVSGEEGLRPKSYYIVFSFVEYAFTDALKYVMAPGSSYGAEGDGGTAPLAVTGLSVTQCLVCLFPVSYCFSLKDVLSNLPSRAAALAAGAPHGQLRMRYAAWVEWVASERKTPTEEYVATAGGYCGPPARWAGTCASSSLRKRLFAR